ncbi:hypothetical protein FNV43_RR14340 [Rhamnella rubrinervis]|uniref:PWWP domain-containing protein n=1 Tax=Rhamnella rubrinervis TaxID=2594499 RepID=A0A8K0H2M7_9ROSA|nr:hypothetical protein FNV43_RR14340 [Rhamnella rubrinervis]
MGTVETRSKTLASSSARPHELAKPQAPGEKTLRAAIEGKSEPRVGSRSTAEDSVQVNRENGIKDSVKGKDDLDDDEGSRVIEVVRNRVVKTQVSAKSGISSSEEGGLLELSLPRKRESGREGRGRHGGRSRSTEDMDEVHEAKSGIVEKKLFEENGISLNGNKKRGPYGKLRTIEVPIVETSENNEGEVEGMSDQGHEFSVGDFVWGKIKSHPWWPGQIYDPSHASDIALKFKPKDRFLVAYFGDATFAWCQPSQLKPFEKNFVEMSKQSSSKAFVNAVQQAVDEIGSLLELKMTCSCVPKEDRTGLSQPSAVNSGIKEGVPVPEGGIRKLSAFMFEPAKLLAGLKRTAQIVYMPSVLELGVLQSRLSAFYRLKGGYQLPIYHEPQPTPGLEDNWKSVEIPAQGPFEDWLSSPVGASFVQNKQSRLQTSPGVSESRIYHRRKQKSIADLMGKDKDSEAKTKDKEITEERSVTGKETSLSRRKKRKGREEYDDDGDGDSNLTSETGKGRKVRFSGSPIGAKAKRVDSDEKTGSVVEEESKKGLTSRGRKKNVVISEHDDSEGKIETAEHPVSKNRKLKSHSLQKDDSEAKEQIEKGSLSPRERKKSKYLSPPFMIINSSKKKREIETESLKVSNEAWLGERITRVSDHLTGSPQLLSSSSDMHHKDLSTESGANDETSHGSSPKTKIQGQNKIVDPTIANVAADEVLSQIRSLSINPFSLRGKKSFEMVVGYLSIFRESIYHNGSNYKLYKKHQPCTKRKILDSEVDELPGKDPNQGSKMLAEHEPDRRRRKKNEDKEIGKPEQKQASGTSDASEKRRRKKNEEREADKPKQMKAAGTRDASEQRRRKKNEDREEDKPEQKQAAGTHYASEQRRRRKNEDREEDKPEQKQAAGTRDASEQRRRRKNEDREADKPEQKQAAGTFDTKSGKRQPKQAGETPDLKTRDKKTEEEASAAVIFVTFGPGSSLPTKADLISIYSEFGDLNEKETEMFYNNFCARVSFIYSSDAEKAFAHSQNANPFESANVSFRLRYLCDASKTRELSEISSQKTTPSLKRRGRKSTPKKLPTAQPSVVEVTELDFVRDKLEMMTSMLQNSDRKMSPTMKSKLEGEMKGLLQKVNTMVASSSSSKIG